MRVSLIHARMGRLCKRPGWVLSLALLACPDESSTGPSSAEPGMDVEVEPEDGFGFGPEMGLDVSVSEVGESETGVRDGGYSVGNGFGVRVVPEPVLFPAGRGSSASISIRNDGPEAALIRSVSVLTADGREDNSDFRWTRCTAPRCVLDVVLCDPGRFGCSDVFVPLELRYENPDRSASDQGILRIEIDGRTPLDAIVFATDRPCPFPQARPELGNPGGVARLGETVVLDGRRSDSGGNIPLDFFFWALTETPDASVPVIFGQGTSVATFTASVAGFHGVELTVTNACGQSSLPPGQLRFEVVATP